MEVMSLKSFIGGIHPKDQKQYTDTQNKLENELKREPELRIQYENLKEEEKTVDTK